MRIFVGGSLRVVPRDLPQCREFATALGREIVELGHVVLNGCRSLLDTEVARSAHEWLVSNGGNPEEMIISYCHKDAQPAHSFGRVRASALPDWQMNHPELRIPEQIELAGATIFVAGGRAPSGRRIGRFMPESRSWAFRASAEPVKPFTTRRWRVSAKALAAAAEEYETLNQLAADMSAYAKDVVGLARSTGYAADRFHHNVLQAGVRDVFASYQEACRRFEFDAQRTDESMSLERIIPRVGGFASVRSLSPT